MPTLAGCVHKFSSIWMQRIAKLIDMCLLFGKKRDAREPQGGERMDDSFRDTLFAITSQAEPASRQAEGTLGHLKARQCLERGLRCQLASIIAGLHDEELEPRSTLTLCIEDHLGFGGIQDVRRYLSVSVKVGLAFALSIARRRLGRPAGCRRARLAPDALSTYEQRDTVDRVERQARREVAEPPRHCLPEREMAQQHLPAAVILTKASGDAWRKNAS